MFFLQFSSKISDFSCIFPLNILYSIYFHRITSNLVFNMNFVARKRRILVDTGFSEFELSLYNNDLQMYSTAPDSKLTLREFEEQALERVRVLRIIEQTSAKGKGSLTMYNYLYKSFQDILYVVGSLLKYKLTYSSYLIWVWRLWGAFTYRADCKLSYWRFINWKWFYIPWRCSFVDHVFLDELYEWLNPFSRIALTPKCLGLIVT